ncbi:YebC/PmpR family DNA-binding transcriptional regulator [Patescibacteria group bacterium]|nr:MAG: YebC/PmpR family DNA-binding transcriptional regulator [Patescibacteria group bacterium]
MSKHSKWAKVKTFKGAVDAKRASVFTKLGRAITVAAKQGGGDPAMNFQLRTAIEKAKEASMPKETIERAIARGSGGGDGAVIEEAIYEGFSPGGAAIVARALTDNKNRTLQNLRTIFGKHGGNLAGQNAVTWMFEKKGVLRVPHAESGADEFLLRLIDLGAEDVHEEDGGFTVLVPSDKLEAFKAALEREKITVEFAEASLLPKERLHFADLDARARLEGLIEALENDDDVDEVVTNAEL